MKTVTATIIMRGNPGAQFGQNYEPRTVYQSMSSDDYRMLVSSNGRVRLDNTAGMPIMVDMAEVASITCGPERED